MKEKINDNEPGPWSPPPELSGDTPRKVKWKGSGWASAILAGILTLMAIGVANSLSDVKAQEERLGREGQYMDAVATRVWRKYGKTTHYNVAYEFSVAARRCEANPKSRAAHGWDCQKARL